MFGKKKSSYPFPFLAQLPSGQELVLVHIPKTAGTSIKRTFGIPIAHKDSPYSKHHSAEEIRDLLGLERWNAAYKVAFVRNPWDRLTSFYRYRRRKALGRGEADFPNFHDWAHQKLHKSNFPRSNFRPQASWLYDSENTLLVDYLGTFEELPKHFNHLCQTLLAKNPKLYHINSTYATDSYKEYYDEATKKLVADKYQADIITFHYQF